MTTNDKDLKRMEIGMELETMSNGTNSLMVDAVEALRDAGLDPLAIAHAQVLATLALAMELRITWRSQHAKPF